MNMYSYNGFGNTCLAEKLRKTA